MSDSALGVFRSLGIFNYRVWAIGSLVSNIGTWMQRTAQDWLANFDANRDAIEIILRGVYGNDTALWMRRWRWFFLATSGLFGYADGSEWGISHYRMAARSTGGK